MLFSSQNLHKTNNYITILDELLKINNFSANEYLVLRR